MRISNCIENSKKRRYNILEWNNISYDDRIEPYEGKNHQVSQ